MFEFKDFYMIYNKSYSGNDVFDKNNKRMLSATRVQFIDDDYKFASIVCQKLIDGVKLIKTTKRYEINRDFKKLENAIIKEIEDNKLKYFYNTGEYIIKIDKDILYTCGEEKILFEKDREYIIGFYRHSTESRCVVMYKENGEEGRWYYNNYSSDYILSKALNGKDENYDYLFEKYNEIKQKYEK